jgi:hypothetical protein
MGKSDHILPPGPNPREDQMTEKDQEQLRQFRRSQRKVSAEGEESGEEELQAADPVEGERSAEHEFRVGHTPGQAEGDRKTVEEEEEKRH